MGEQHNHKPAIFDALSEPVSTRAAAGIERLGAALQHHAWEASFGKGLTPTQDRVLKILEKEDRAALGTGVLAERLQVSAPTVSDALAALERKGLIARERGEIDKRAVSITLTEAGKELAGAADARSKIRAAVDAMPPALQVELLRGVSAAIRELQQAGDIPIQRMCVICRYFRPNIHADPRLPHYCAFVDAPFGDEHLRLDCQEQETASGIEQQENWARFIAPIINTSTGPTPSNI